MINEARNFELGQIVYLEHPQSHLRPNTIIDARIVAIREIKTTTTYYEYDFKTLNGESIKYEYEVRLTPSRTMITVKESEIYSDLNILREKIKEKILLRKQELQKESDNLILEINT